MTVKFTLALLTVAHSGPHPRIHNSDPIRVRHEGKFRPTTSTLGEVNIRRLVLRQFNQFAAAIVLGKNFAVKHGSPPSGCLGVEPKIFDCFVTVQSQRNAYLLAPFVRGKTLVSLFVCNSRFTFEQNCNFTELTQMTWKAVLLAVSVENGEGRIISLIFWLLGVNLSLFLDYGGRFDTHMCL